MRWVEEDTWPEGMPQSKASAVAAFWKAQAEAGMATSSKGPAPAPPHPAPLPAVPVAPHAAPLPAVHAAPITAVPVPPPARPMAGPVPRPPGLSHRQAYTSYGTERRSREAASTRTGLAVGTTDLRILKGTIRNGKKKLADERF